MSSTSESDSMLILHTFSTSFVISSLTSPTSSLLLLPVASPERSFWSAVSPSGDSGSSFLVKYLFRSVSVRSEIYEDLLVKRPGQLAVHLTPPPNRLQLDQSFPTQKSVAVPKIICHQNSFWYIVDHRSTFR